MSQNSAEFVLFEEFFILNDTVQQNPAGTSLSELCWNLTNRPLLPFSPQKCHRPALRFRV